MANRRGKGESSDRFLFHGLQNHCGLVTVAMKSEDDCFLAGKQWQTDITLPTKFVVKAMVFPVVTYGCENWTVKKADRQRIDALELWCWRTFLRAPWSARRSNQSILKKTNPEYSLKGLIPKLQYFGHLMQRADSLEEVLMLGKIESKRRRGSQRMKWLDSITDSKGMK